jgi:hypothetical protein
MIENLWNLKIQILPVVITLVICELPALTRWFNKIPYVPIYFSVFPFSIINRDLSIYLRDDYAYGDDNKLPEDEIERLRKHIINIFIISTTLSVIVTPFLGGFFSAFFLPRDSFSGFCVIFIVYKLIGATEATFDFSKREVANKKTMTWFIIVYLVYLGLFLYIFGETYNWAESFVLKGDWIGLLMASYRGLFGKLILSALILGLLARLASTAITDRKLRDQINE